MRNPEPQTVRRQAVYVREKSSANLNLIRLIKTRANSDPWMIVGLMVGVLFATATAAGIPQYTRSLEIVSMRAAVEDVGKHNRNVHVNSSWVPLSDEGHVSADSAVRAASEAHLGALIVNSTRLTKSRAHWWGWNEKGLRTDDLASQAAFQYIENLDDHVDYIKGVAPTDTTSTIDGETTIEVAVAHERARILQISVGDVINTQPVDRGTGLVRAIITGTFEMTDPSEIFWLQLGQEYLEPAIEGRDQPLILLPTESSMFSVVAEANAGLPASYDWFLYVDPVLMSDMSIKELQTFLGNFQAELESTIARPFIITEMTPRLAAMKQRALFGSIPLLLMALMVLACVGFYLTMAAGLIGRRRIAGYMMLKSRGFNISQQFGIHLMEAAIVAIPAAILGPVVSILTIAVIGYLPTYDGITGGSTMPFEVAASAWIWSFGAAFGAVVMITAASSFWDRSTLSSAVISDGTRVSAPWFQRFYIDALLVALSGILWWEVGARNGIVVSERGEDFTPDLSLLAAPILIVLAVSLVALRLFPIITTVFVSFGLRTNSTALGLGFASVARRPFFHGWPMLAFSLAISTGIVAGSVVSTLERSTNEQVFYRTGADVHVVTRGTTGQVDRNRLEVVREVEAVDVATPALRTIATVGTTSSGSQFHLLAIDPIDFQRVAWFRDDFSDSETSITQLIDRLAVRIHPEAIELPPNTTHLSIRANIDVFTPKHELWIVVRDSLGDFHTLNMGQIREGWFITATNMPNLAEPITIASIQTSLAVGPYSAPTAILLVDDLIATTSNGETHLVVDFDQPELWTGLPTAEGEDTGFTINPEPQAIDGLTDGDSGTGIGNISLGRGSSQGVRGIYRRAVDRPIPIIANEFFLTHTGVGLRRPFLINVQGGLVPVEVIDSIKYFPTIDPEDGPFVIADLDAIVDFVLLRGRQKITPNELFASLEESDTPEAEISENIRGVFRLAHIVSRSQQINTTFVDPIAVAGWRGMSIIATITAGFVVLMAYAIFLAAYSLRTKGDSALILALGASSRDHWISTLAELFPAILVGTAVGLGTGFAVSSLMVGSMAHTGSGGHLLPPFILQTNWALPLVTIAAIFLIVLIGVVNSVRSFRKIQIAHMAREGFSAAST